MTTCMAHRLSALLLLAACSGSVRSAELTLAEYQNKAKGAWAGQMIGVSYGAPYEFKARGTILEGPLREWKPEFVDNSIHQDDVYVEMTFLKALEDHGLDITNEQAGKAFADSEYNLWHANKAGRDNCRNGIMPPASGHPDNNPHADDIDFQIEADLFGIITPGMPQACNRLCDRFGHVMNYGDGVYGGMFVAGMYCAAFFEDDVEKVVAAGLACIPAESKYAQLISDVIASHAKAADDWQACWQLLEEKWAPNDLCPGGRGNPLNIDAKLNGGYIAIGLLYGDGDFEKTLEITTRCGQDADCNPSNAAGVLGTILGFDGIPEQFRSGIADIADRNFSFTEYNFGTLTDACTRVARQVVEANGGTIQQTGDGETWQIELQPPRPPETLEQWVMIDQDLRLRARPGREGDRGILVAWDPVPTATSYQLVREDSDEPVFTTTNATPFEDTKAPVGQPVSYRMRVRLPDGEWHGSAPVSSFIFVPTPTNERGDTNLARSDFATPDAAVLSPTGGGLKDIAVIRDGVTTEQNYDSFDGKNEAAEDWYAIRFARAVRANSVEYVEGNNFHDGGWWLSLTVQYLDPETFGWHNCSNVRMSPEYDFEDRQENRKAYTPWTFTFDEVTCAGIRIFGKPGGEADFTSIAELEVYYR